MKLPGSVPRMTYREKKICCGSRHMTAGGKERWSGKSARAGEREGGIGGMGGSGSDPATVSETHAAAQNRVTRGHRWRGSERRRKRPLRFLGNFLPP